MPVRQDDVTASYKDGILEIHLPKAEANRPRKVQVVGNAETAAPLEAAAPAPAANRLESPAQESNGAAEHAAQTIDAGENS